MGKSLDLQAGEGNTLVLTKKTKATKKPAKSVKKVELKKRHPRQLKAVAAEAQNVRPDLKVRLLLLLRQPTNHEQCINAQTAALRRASALHKAQVKKAATA